MDTILRIAKVLMEFPIMAPGFILGVTKMVDIEIHK
jgi:hypothetical protein